MGGVFVSCRNDDRPETAGAINSELVKRFGRHLVFHDADPVQAGERYPAVQLATLADADVLVAVIGPGLLATDGSGIRLIYRDHDWVRIEIATAYRIGIPVVPVLLAGAALPERDELPPDIRQLADVEALPLLRDRLEADLERLVARVEQAAPLLGISRLFAPGPPSLRPPECAPSTLLRPEFGLVEVTGRDRELGLLRAWASEAQPRSAMYLTGPPGSGKTRLAAVLCAELTATGWAAGFLAEDAPAADLAHAGRIGTPLFVAVEDVGSQLDRVAALAVAITAASAPVRILLLGRGEGAWLRALCDHPDRRVSALFQPVTTSSRIELDAMTSDAGDQFDRAVRAFGRVLARSGSAGHPADGGTSVLDIHAMALDEVLRPAPVSGGEAGVDPIRAVVAADRRWFRSAVRSRGQADLATAHLATVAAVATLCRPASGAQVAVLLNRLPAFLGADGHRTDDYARVYADLYPGRFWLDAVRPAPIGDHVVATTVAARPNIVTTLAGLGDDRQIGNALAVLGRCAARHPETGRAIVALVRAAPDRIGPLGADAVARIDEPEALAGWLAVAMCHEGTSVEGFLATIERLRHRMCASARAEFVRGFAREVARQLGERPRRTGRFALAGGSRAGAVESVMAALADDLLDGRITAEQVRSSATESPSWMLESLARLALDEAQSSATAGTKRLERLLRRHVH